MFDPEMNRGYTCLGEETLDPLTQKRGDTKEGFYIGRDVPLEKANKDKFSGPNVYPSDDLGMVGWRETMDTYIVKAQKVCLELLQMIAEGLE